VSVALPANEQTIVQAAAVLRDGGLIGLPTETVYGLAADASNGEAVAGIFAAKGRPTFNPLISHVLDIAMASAHAHIPPLAQQLCERFWPGPLTLVLKRQKTSSIHTLSSAGLDTVALRAPVHPIARAVISAFDGPVAAPSANPSGKLSPTRANHVLEGLGNKVSLVLDAGPCAIGLESTVVRVQDDHIIVLREGAVTREQLLEFGEVAGDEQLETVNSPGQLLAHYAPDVPLRINVAMPFENELFIGFGDTQGDFSLSPSGCLEEAAAALFDTLAQANKHGAAAIAVAPIPEKGLGRAINDRLRRAAYASTTPED